MRKLLIFLLIQNICFGSTYYIRNGGGTGSGLDSANAWSMAHYKSIYNSLPAGTIIKLKRGDTYYGEFPVVSGTAGSRMVYDAFGTGASPIISGYTYLTSWTATSNSHIFYATVSSPQLQMVSIDGALQPMGRYPNVGYLQYTGTDGVYGPGIPVSPGTWISGTTIQTLPANFTGGEVVIKKYRYILDRHQITNQVGDKIFYSSNNFYGQNAANPPTVKNGYFVQGHLATLDRDGEWFFDKAANRFYCYFNVSPAGRSVRVNTIDKLVTLNSTAYVTFNNIDFEGANVGIQNNGTNSISINNCFFREFGTGVYAADCNALAFNGGGAIDCYSNGIFGESDCPNTIVNAFNTLRCGMIPGAGESGDGKYNSIGIGGDGLIISNCSVKYSGFNGIVYDGNNIIIEKNFVDSFCMTKDDGGGLYTFTNPPFTVNGVYHPQIRSNRVVRNNTVLHAIGNSEGGQWMDDFGSQAAGIYLDGFTNNVDVIDNDVAYGKWPGILINANSSNRVINNKVFDFLYGLAIPVVNATPGGYGSVRNLEVRDNTFIARTSNQTALYINLAVNDDPRLLGIFDNNTYAKPLDANTAIGIDRTYSGGGGLTYHPLSYWQNLVNQDFTATISQVSVTDPNLFKYDYNVSSAEKIVDLQQGIYKDVDGSVYNQTATIPPYNSQVFIFQSNAVIVPVGRGVYVNGGKILVNGNKALTNF